jgi:hypothetical protein
VKIDIGPSGRTYGGCTEKTCVTHEDSRRSED